MSLKAFHVFFIVVATLFSLGFGVWALQVYRQTADTMLLIMGILSLAASVCLIWYFRWFLKKLKNVSYL